MIEEIAAIATIWGISAAACVFAAIRLRKSEYGVCWIVGMAAWLTVLSALAAAAIGARLG